MTFTEDIAIIMESQRNVNNIGCALKAVLYKAEEEGRLVVGIYECAQMLQNTPEDVGLCLLPEVAQSEDVTVHIHHKLVEAFCWENDIEVIKVKTFKKLENMITGEKSADVGCILIKHVKTDNSTDDFINNYYSILANQAPVIDLPE